jgi:hypothetical protein
MSPCPCLYVRVSMSMSLCPCLHVYVAKSPCPCLHFSMFSCLISIFPCPCLHVAGIHKGKTELIGNSNFCLFAASGKRKRLTSIGLLQTKTENGSLFALIGKRSAVIDYCCFSKLGPSVLKADEEPMPHCLYFLYPPGLFPVLGPNECCRSADKVFRRISIQLKDVRRIS